jgi:hypothetical protein
VPASRLQLAPARFARWLAAHEHPDRRYGWVYRYHPRSDAHSIALCQLILEDLLVHCKPLRDQGLAGKVVYGINYGYTFPRTGKAKTIDLALGTGTADTTLPAAAGIYRGTVTELRLACEAKTVMTEHSKSQPRIFDELSSSHEIVHKGQGQQTLAAGIAVVNIARTFVSPLRQKGAELHVTQHKQPRAAERMVNHLRGLPVRDTVDEVGFDAYATVVVDCDNQGPASLWKGPPAPQPGDPDHYGTFLARLSAAYRDRFAE